MSKVTHDAYGEWIKLEKAMERMEEIIACWRRGFDLDKSLEVFEGGHKTLPALIPKAKGGRGRIKLIMEEQEGEPVQFGTDLEGDNDLDF